jgi:hypothetical protein
MKHRAMKFRCSSCGRTFTTRFEEDDDREDTNAEPTTSRAPAPPPTEAPSQGPGMLLKQEGKVYHVKDTATMQKWIVERRVLREDLVSIGGVRWEPVGSRPELEVFFQVVEQADQAQALATGGPPLPSVPPPETPLPPPPPPLPGPDFSSSTSDVTAATELIARPSPATEDPTPLSGEDVDDDDSEDTSSGISVGLPVFPEPQLLAASYKRPEPVDLLQADPEDVVDPFSIDAFPTGLPDADEPTEPSPLPTAVHAEIEAAQTPIEQVPFASRVEPPPSRAPMFALAAIAMVAIAGAIYAFAPREPKPVAAHAQGSPPEAPAAPVSPEPVPTPPVAEARPEPTPAIVEPPPSADAAPVGEPAVAPPPVAVAPAPEPAPVAAPPKPKEPPAPKKPDVRAMIDKAWEAADRGDFAAARRLFAQVQAIQPANAQAAYGLGYTTEKLGDSRESAIAYYCTAKRNVGSDTDLAREVAGRLQALSSDCPE